MIYMTAAIPVLEIELVRQLFYVERKKQLHIQQADCVFVKDIVNIIIT